MSPYRVVADRPPVPPRRMRMTVPSWIAAVGAAVECAIGVYMAWLAVTNATFLAPVVVAVGSAVMLVAEALDRREAAEVES